MRKPLMLRLYLGFAHIAGPLWRLALHIRRRRGREDAARLPEKFGHASAPRPDGRLIWFHAVSVGESLALMTLLRRLSGQRPDLGLLLTTSTLASAEALDKVGLPPRVIHQYAPADAPGPVGRFLAHWRPDAAVIAEADMWPLTILRSHAAGVPMILLNSIVTERRYRRRRRVAGFYAYMFRLFRRILLQDERSLELFAELGAPQGRMSVMGVLKSASDPLPDLPDTRAGLEAAMGSRPRWLAAATKAPEEPQVIEAHRLAVLETPDLLLILAPRQVKDADATEALARTAFSRVARRSRGDPLAASTQVYIADTIGEMGLWYRLAPVAFMGHSLPVEGRPLTGKNPFEAIALGAMVVHGPHFGNFTETYRRLHAEGAALQVADAAGLAGAVRAAQDPAFRAPFLAGAERVQAENQAPLEIALETVQALADGRL